MALLACATMGDWPVIKQIAYVLGFVMRGIFDLLDLLNIHSITLCIVLFTVITRMLLLPMTISQQKYSRMTAVMNPELQAIQKKYANKKDTLSMQKMQTEQQAVYDKYGVSMTSGCLSSLIQIPLLFALYPVVYNLERYIPELANFTEEELAGMYTLFGVINLNESPTLGLNVTVLIPILAGGVQFLSTRLMMINQPNMEGNSMGSSMKMMNYTMPLISIIFCFSFPCFIGVYWIAMSAVMIVQQLFINWSLNRQTVDDMIQKNVAKKNKKRAKQGLPPINDKATMSTRNLAVSEAATARAAKPQREFNKEANDAKVREATNYYASQSARPGSLAAKANMVQEYDKKHSKNNNRNRSNKR